MFRTIQRRVHFLRRQKCILNRLPKHLLLFDLLFHTIPLIANAIHRGLDEFLMDGELLLVEEWGEVGVAVVYGADETDGVRGGLIFMLL